MHNTLASIKRWLERAIPHPKARNQTTQLGVHFEEVAEMMDAVMPGFEDQGPSYSLAIAARALRILSDDLKTGRASIDWTKVNRVEFLDSLSDQIVTSVGCGHVLGMDIVGATDEVDRSNWSKFVDGQPVFDENLKIIKGKDYFKAKLDTFV